jgi:hypothetical protein
MKSSIPLLFALAFIAGISSCAHDCGTCPGISYQTDINLLGFTDSDVTPLSLLSYVKGSNFTVYRGDTVFTHLANGSTNHSVLFLANDSTDYVVVPGHLQGYQVSDMKFTLTKCNYCPQSYDPYLLTAYTLSGTVVNPGLGIVIQK